MARSRIAELVDELLRELARSRGRLGKRDVEALRRLILSVEPLVAPRGPGAGSASTQPPVSTAVLVERPGPAPAPALEERLAAKARERLREALLGRFVVKLAGWSWKRRLAEYRRETGDLLPASWAEQAARLVAPNEPELAEAVARRWLRRIIYHASGRPLPGEEEAPSPEAQAAASAVLSTLEEALEKLHALERKLPPRLRALLETTYALAVYATAAGITPDIYTFLELLDQLEEEGLKGYVEEALARYNTPLSREAVEETLKRLMEHPPSPLIWLATGTLVPPPAQQAQRAPPGGRKNPGNPGQRGSASSSQAERPYSQTRPPGKAAAGNRAPSSPTPPSPWRPITATHSTNSTTAPQLRPA